jgi:hypothetical protein
MGLVPIGLNNFFVLFIFLSPQSVERFFVNQMSITKNWILQQIPYQSDEEGEREEKRERKRKRE